MTVRRNANVYAITAVVHWVNDDGYNAQRVVPLFYLHERVQGILTEQHACEVARDIVTAGARDGATAEITAVAMNAGDLR